MYSILCLKVIIFVNVIMYKTNILQEDEYILRCVYIYRPSRNNPTTGGFCDNNVVDGEKQTVLPLHTLQIISLGTQRKSFKNRYGFL